MKASAQIAAGAIKSTTSHQPRGRSRSSTRTVDPTAVGCDGRQSPGGGACRAAAGVAQSGNEWVRAPTLGPTAQPGSTQRSDGGAQQDVPVSTVRSFQLLTEVTLATLRSCSTTSRRGSMYAFDQGA